MDKVRLGIIGMGNIGKYHADYLLNQKINRCELMAVCDAITAPLEKFKPLRIFGDGEQLIKSCDVDAVIIATPHFQQNGPAGICETGRLECGNSV
jgi:predicted dehydrogenase